MNYIIDENGFGNILEIPKHAGGKAPKDVYSILVEEGFKGINMKDETSKRENKNAFGKILMHYSIYRQWNRAVKNLNENDTIVIQYPIINHTLLFGLLEKKLKRKKVKLVVVVHDIVSLRNIFADEVDRMQKRLMIEEETLLKNAYKVIAHNARMKKYLIKVGVKPEHICTLEIFDYLISYNDKYESEEKNINYEALINQPIVIAGNLTKNKAGYVYKLPGNVMFNLYGVNYDEESTKDNVTYCGAFDPDELPYKMNGSFGLVWDGDDTNTCSGIYGSYLKFNNPHKVSLYIASGIPVIIWNKAAMAKFVLKNKCGIVIDNLDTLKDKISGISVSEYKDMKNNCLKISERLQEGYYIKKAMDIID